jgi:signal transduction histidine kinase
MRRHSHCIKTEDEVGNVCLTAEDSGPGFSSDDAGKLFDAFFTTKKEGMGMGLSLSKTIVESHNGHILARSNDGSGATFGVSIPYGSTG